MDDRENAVLARAHDQGMLESHARYVLRRFGPDMLNTIVDARRKRRRPAKSKAKRRAA